MTAKSVLTENELNFVALIEKEYLDKTCEQYAKVLQTVFSVETQLDSRNPVLTIYKHDDVIVLTWQVITKARSMYQEQSLMVSKTFDLAHNFDLPFIEIATSSFRDSFKAFHEEHNTSDPA